MTAITPPLPQGGRADAAADADADEFRVRAPIEVRDLLRRLQDERVLLHLHTADGAHLTTTLRGVDTAREVISFDADTDAGDTDLARLLDAQEISAVGFLDSIRLQFDLQGAVLVRGAATALNAMLPRVLYRFQRRGAFRVRPIERSEPTAFLPHPMIPEMQLALRVLDVSASGCALFVPDDVPPLDLGVRVNHVRVELDSSTTVTSGLLLRHVTAINPQSRGARLGCEWIGLNGPAARSLQQFIDQTQKKRRLLQPR